MRDDAWHYSSFMFFFERDVSGRLILAARKHLPDSSGDPFLLNFLQKSPFDLKNVVLAMVHRGDFDVAVRKLTDLLMTIATDHRYKFDLDDSKNKVTLGIDSMLVVLEALLAAFTQQIIEMGFLDKSVVDLCKPSFQPLWSIYAWSPVSKMPPLEDAVALDLLALMGRVLPVNVTGVPLAASLTRSLHAKLCDALLSMAQYIYFANPNIVHDATEKALAEWDYPARIDLLMLSPSDSESLGQYLRLVRSYLPRLDSNDQLKLMQLVNESIVRGVICKPTCSWADPSVNGAIAGFCNAVEKSRPFRSLRAFRSHEALVITVMELIKMANTLYKKMEPVSTDTISEVEPKLLSVAHLKAFERAASLVKRDNPADKRVASRLAAMEYLITVGFIGLVVSERPQGAPYRGLALDIQQYVPQIFYDFDNLNEQYKVLFAAYCSRYSSYEDKKLVHMLDSELTLQKLRLIFIIANREYFVEALNKNSSNFCEFVSEALKSQCDAVVSPLNMLASLPQELMPMDILKDVLSRLAQYITKNFNMEDSQREVLVSFLTLLVSKCGVDELLEALMPLIPTEDPVEILRDPFKLKAFYQFLRLLAHDHRIVPVHYLEGGEVLANKVPTLRTSLMLCLCSDSNTGIEIALKCLELLQSDPHQSPAERDLVSELLDSMDQSLPSTSVMQRRMTATLAADPDESFQDFNKAVRDALELFKEGALTDKVHANLLRTRIATLPLEPPAVRAAFYIDFMELDGGLVNSIAGSIPIGSALAKEFFRSITRAADCSLTKSGPIKDSKLNGCCQLCAWLLDCLETDHPSTASELRLGELAARAVSILNPNSGSTNEVVVLKLVEATAKYAAKDNLPQATSIAFSQVVDMLLDRPWERESSPYLANALAAVFEHYKEPDDDNLKMLVNKILSMNLKGIQIQVLSPLLNENLEALMQIHDGISSLNDMYRASVYEALTRRYQLKNIKPVDNIESGDFVMFLLENKPVLEALCDVCTVNGDHGVSTALVQLFQSHSMSAERRLVELAVNHEIRSSHSPSDLFRSNSVTMKVLLEWLRSNSSSYLSTVLTPALGSLRCASIRDGSDMETLFQDAAARFRSRHLPVHLQWLLCLVKEAVTPKYGDEIAKQSISVLMVLRFICPAVVAPHCFGVARRPPARHFAIILRKFANYLQRSGQYICESMAYIDKDRSGSSGATKNCMSMCSCAHEYEALFSGKEITLATKPESEEQFTSATRQVYHFLRRHSVEVRVVLLSSGNGEMIAKMFRYFRIGRNQSYMEHFNSVKIESGKRQKALQTYLGYDVVAVRARDICSEEGVSKIAVKELGSRKEPTVIDFTDFAGLFDRWAEFMLYMAYSVGKDSIAGHTYYALNCPRRTKCVIERLKDLVSLPVQIKFSTSCDYDSISELPPSLPDIRSAVTDIMGAIPFHVQVRSGPILTIYEADVYVGAKFIQIINEGSCDVIPYITTGNKGDAIAVRLVRDELQVSALGSEFTIYSPSSSMLRILKLSLVAANAEKFGASIDFGERDSSPLFNETPPPSDVDSQSDTISGTSQNNTLHDPSHTYMVKPNSNNVIKDSICPGKLLFAALYDSMHDSGEVRRRAIELYSVLPDSLGLQLSIPGSQQSLMPNQVYALAAYAAKRHPELAVCIASGLALLGKDITEKAAQIAAPWVPYLVAHNAEQRTMLRAKVLMPLLKAVSDAPQTVGPVLLEHFWPLFHHLPTLTADLLLEVSMEAPPESLEALRQIVAGGIPSDRPHESREFAEALLAKLYSVLRCNGDASSTLWSKHPEWHEINVCIILIGSIAVDWQTAELLFPDVSFLVLILAGVGTLHLRNALHYLLLNYLNAFLQSPSASPTQRLRLQASRSELMGPRGCVLFGVQRDIYDSEPAWVSDDYTDYTPEMTEHLGRLLSDISAAVFSTRLSGYQETRVAIASRVMEFIDVVWPPLQRRCILALVGAVRFLMPESVVADLVRQLGAVLSEKTEGSLETRGVLVTTFLRMFGETVECIPDAGIYHRYLFWLSVVALSTGCGAIQMDAVRLLRESIKIAHFRGSFREKSVAQVYLETRPIFIRDDSNALPIDVPTTEENFHIALAQLLVPSLQHAESQTLALECCDVLATACPSEFVYAAFLYLGGEEGRIAARVPTGAFADTEDAVAQWLASRVRRDDPKSVLTLALCAEISGFSRSMNFSQTGPRLFDLVVSVKDRSVVNIIAPLLRPTFLRLLKLDDRETEFGLIKWSLYIFSSSINERQKIALDKPTLHDIIADLNLRPFFDENFKIRPLFFEDSFTETTRHVLNNFKWIRSSQKATESSFQPSFGTEKLF